MQIPVLRVPESLSRLTGSRSDARWQIAIGVAFALVGALLRVPLNSQLGQTLAFLTFFPAVAAAGWAAGFVGGLACVLVSAFLATYFVLEPAGMVGTDDVFPVIAFVASGVLISALGGQLHRSRREAEVARDRAAFLADASAILSTQLDRLATIESLANAAVPRFADWCAIDLFAPGGEWITARVAARDPETVATVQRIRRDYPYNPDDPAGVPAVFRTGAPEFVLDVPPDFASAIPDPTLRGLMEQLGIASYISVPLSTPTGSRLGVLSVVRSGEGRRFSPADVDTAVDLGRRAGTALDHATLFAETRARRDELDAVIEALDDPVLVAGPDGLVAHANRSAKAVLGDVTARPLRQVIDRLPTVPGRPEVRHAQKPGRYLMPVELEVTTEANAHVAILRDVTALLETEAARDAFVGMLSHELRTPITTIFGTAQILRRHAQRNGTSEMIDDLAQETERLYRLVEDLLVLSRYERGRLDMALEPVLVHRVVETIAARSRTLYRDLAIRVEAAPPLPTVMADTTYLEQILRNLVSNTVKYAGPTARVEVSVTEVDGQVRIRFQDDGPGIEPGDVERAFKLYERLDGATRMPGAGIGLFVCRRLVEAMGGQMTAGRGELGGALFEIRLPVADEDAATDRDGDGRASSLVSAG